MVHLEIVGICEHFACGGTLVSFCFVLFFFSWMVKQPKLPTSRQKKLVPTQTGEQSFVDKANENFFKGVIQNWPNNIHNLTMLTLHTLGRNSVLEPVSGRNRPSVHIILAPQSENTSPKTQVTAHKRLKMVCSTKETVHK